MEIVMITCLMLIAGYVHYRDYKSTPMCHWCNVRHYGRCMYNPRSGKIMANNNDGQFDYYDPNK